jgi:endonuclease VIII
MPEGDTIFRTAKTLNQALADKAVKSFETVLPKLARVEYDSGVVGRTIEKVEAQGKWLKIYFSGDLILLTHMLMSGCWHIYRPGEKWKKRRTDYRITIGTEKIVAVAFNVPIAEFHSTVTLERRLRRVGPSMLAKELDERTILGNLRVQGNMEVGTALLDQSVLAGIGNVFKSEVCFACGVNPFRRVDTLTIQEAACLVATARKFMLANVGGSIGDGIVTYRGMRTTTGRLKAEERLWVYQRPGKACRQCGTGIEMRRQMPGARSTYWCPRCQPMVTSAGAMGA